MPAYHNLDLAHNGRVFEVSQNVTLLDYDGKSLTPMTEMYSNAVDDIIKYFFLFGATMFLTGYSLIELSYCAINYGYNQREYYENKIW